jgi:hypothetical protein
VAVGSQAIISKGDSCAVEVVSIESGKEMASRLRNVHLMGKTHRLSTEYADVDAQGPSKTKKAVRRGIEVGAAGAGIGVLAGGGSGAISAAGVKGKTLNVPAETRLSFSLKASVPRN